MHLEKLIVYPSAIKKLLIFIFKWKFVFILGGMVSY